RAAAHLARDIESGTAADRAIGAVGPGRNRALNEGNVFALVVFHRLIQRAFGLAAGRRHQGLVIVERNGVEDEIGDGRMAGAQEGFRVAGAVLKFEPDQDRSRLFFHRLGNGGCGARQAEDRGHRSAKSQKVSPRNAALLQFLPEAKADHRLLRSWPSSRKRRSPKATMRLITAISFWRRNQYRGPARRSCEDRGAT